MNQYTESKAVSLSQTEKSKFLSRTYGWMAFALFLSAAVAYWTSVNIFVVNELGEPVGISKFGNMLFGNSGIGFIILAVLEIAVVIWLTATIRKLSFGVALIGFLFYSVINGLTLSSIFVVYKINSIASAFLASAVTFTVMSLYGLKTKSNLSSAGKYLMMGLMGIILASVIQFVITLITGAPLAMMDLLISIATVVIFTGLTAYDSQKILVTAEYANSSDEYKKVALLGALELYLDFINIFLALLKLFGKRRD
ncbi:MAG: Bax inhibitor-1/YccA family protein [Treponema sp.]|nr:Bax inhibitor-1/YccA family protein [Treponema sp.]